MDLRLVVGVRAFSHSPLHFSPSPQYIMFNFNHERMGIAIQASRFARVCYEESLKYAHKRKTFGKRLVDHPVIRHKLANMARQIEATYEPSFFSISPFTNYLGTRGWNL